MKSRPEEEFAILLRHEGFAPPVRQYRYATSIGRNWRFDFCWPERMLAAEIDGGLYQLGAHNRPAGYERGCVRLNEAALLGWAVLRFTPHQVRNGIALKTIRRALADDR